MYSVYDYEPNSTLFETDPTAFEMVQIYSPLSSSHGLEIVIQLSAIFPPRYLLFEKSNISVLCVHLISLTFGELSRSLKIY